MSLFVIEYKKTLGRKKPQKPYIKEDKDSYINTMDYYKTITNNYKTSVKSW